MFDNWGLFELREHSRKGFDDFWSQIRAENKKLPEGVGVYLVFAPRADGTYVPEYIGQTYRLGGFRTRFETGHFKHAKFASLMKHGPLKICFLALAKKGHPTPVREKGHDRRDRKLIDWLEISLIEWCLGLNDNLMNIKHARFTKSLWVAGYYGNDKAFTAEPAYRELAKLLKKEGTWQFSLIKTLGSSFKASQAVKAPSTRRAVRSMRSNLALTSSSAV